MYNYDYRVAAQTFEVDDIVRPSRSYLRSLGPTTDIKNGVVKGKSGRFYLVQWNHRDDAVPVAPEGLELDPRHKKQAAEASPTPYANRLQALQYTFTSEVASQVFDYIEALHRRLISRPPFEDISSFLSWDYGAPREQGPNKLGIRVWQKDASSYPGDIDPNIFITLDFEANGKVSFEAKAGSDSIVKDSGTSSSSIGMRIGEAWEKKLTGSVDYGRFASAAEAISTGAELTVVMRKGQWPSDMFNKGSILTVTDGGSVGGPMKLKMKGQVMGGPYDFKIVSESGGTYVLESANDRFKRGLKVKLKGAD